MRKVIYAMNSSLDGFIEGTNGDLSWSEPDEQLHRHFNDFDAMIGMHFCGRRLYELMAAFWPTADEDPDAPDYIKEYARIWKAMPKMVFSKTINEVGWNSSLVRDINAGEINKLKEQPGKYMSVAGAGLASAFMQLGLIDEYWLHIHPVIIGAGKPMFGPLKDRINLQVYETHTFGSGVVMLKYRRVDVHQ